MAKIILAASVGIGGRNYPTDVRKIQDRLKALGFYNGVSDGLIGPKTIYSIRLFQSVIVGRRMIGGDGRIDVGGETHRWLEATNTPFWIRMPEKGTGFVNAEAIDKKDKHDFGTSWLADTLSKAAEAYYTKFAKEHDRSPMLINDASLELGGDTPDHAGHETGLDIDLRLPKKDPDDWSGAVWMSREYDRLATRAQIHALLNQSMVSIVYFNDPELLRETINGRPICKKVSGHDNHIHVCIEPPVRSN